MEYCSNGELFDYIVQHQRLHEKASVRIYQQIIAGIEYIHKSGVCHRDLKPENLLLDYDKTLKIVDFGLSNLYEPPEGLLKTACGSPCYAAPEMIAGKKYKGLKTDIWSSGVILYAMVAGFLPFEDPKTSNLYKKILAGDFKIPKFLSTDCAHFISKILEVDPEQRYGIAEIRAHPWYKQFKDRAPAGLFPQKEFMPLNNTIYEQILDQFGFDADYTVKCVEANRHNNITAAYHLMYKKAQRLNKDYVGASSSHVTGSVDRVMYCSNQHQNQISDTATGQQNTQKVQIRGTSTGYNQRNNANLQSVNRDGAKVDLIHEVEEESEINEQRKYKMEL